MRHVYPKLKNIVPKLLIVSDLLHVNLFEPIHAGGPLRMAEVNITNENASFQSIIENAVILDRGETGTSNRIEEIGDEDVMDES